MSYELWDIVGEERGRRVKVFTLLFWVSLLLYGEIALSSVDFFQILHFQ